MTDKKIEDGIDDTEGNMPIRKVVEDGVEDTEGNMPRIRLPKDAVDDGVEGDDTEGNRIKIIR